MALIRFKIEHVIILLLLIIILFSYKSCGDSQDASSTVTTVETEVITKKDSSRDSGIKNKIPETIQIIERPGHIERVEDLKKVSKEDKDKVTTANHYTDTTYFPGSRVISEIISEGRILEKKLTLEVDHIQTTIKTEKTIVKDISGFFISPAISYAPSSGIESLEASLTYINKGSFGISAGSYYNLLTHNTGFKITLHKKIW